MDISFNGDMDKVEAVQELLSDKNFYPYLLMLIVIGLVSVALIVLLFVVAFRIKKRIFNHLEKKQGKSITLQFAEKAVDLILFIIIMILIFGRQNIARSVMGSTAVVAAIVGFAAQDAIKDFFAGLLISLYKPFDVGSRIEFEDGTQGIVENLTLRHVVLKGMDTTRNIVPNSKANSMMLINYSYSDVPRSIVFKFPVSYDTDIEKAKRVIDECICESPISLNKEKFDPQDPNSRSVYFLEVGDSALVLGATVYYPPDVRTEIIRDDINCRVFDALAANGIEIPYNYVNVTMK